MTMQYAQGGNTSTMKPQLTDYHYNRKALIENAKEIVFSRVAKSVSLPKNSGKTIKQYIYIPLLDSRNVNDQGIDASGAKISNGNLYGSSKDVGTIERKLPTLTENGGRVNKVGFFRGTIEGTIQEYGFHYTFTRDSLEFDTDVELKDHLHREAVKGAIKIGENILNIDLLRAAGTVLYTGTATSMATLNGNASMPSLVTFDDFMKLYLELRNNDTPMQTKYIYGSSNVDTKVVAGGYIMYASSDLLPHLMSLKDYKGDPAWVGVEHYGASITPLEHEMGKIGNFRILCPNDLVLYEGAGAAYTAGAKPFRNTNGKFDVYPMLVVGDESFVTINAHATKDMTSFEIITKMPGKETATYHDDPFGKIGFSSIQFWYGFMALRPERIGVILTTCTH